MEKEARKKTRWFSAGVVFILCACTFAHATVLYVQDVVITIVPLTAFYSYSSGSGNLSLSNIGVGATLKLDGMSGNGGYTISGAKVTISSSLIEDNSSGGLAIGDFRGGNTLTLTGTLKYNNVAITPANTSLIVASMVLGSDETWVLQELDESPITIDGSIDFLHGTAGLGSGIVNGNDTLKIGDFRADLSFKSVTPNPTTFAAAQTLKGTASTIQITAETPEPATIFLFTTALLALRIKK